TNPLMFVNLQWILWKNGIHLWPQGVQDVCEVMHYIKKFEKNARSQRAFAREIGENGRCRQ
ncbi:MAG: hypothetical protein WC158_03360, partial [Candidatus Paceibacterota bacterium]